MDELQVPDGVLTTDVVVSLASDVGGPLQVSNSHGDVTDTDLTVVGDLETSVTDKSGSLCVTDETGAVILPRTSESEVIGMLLQPEEGVSGDAGLSLPDTSVLDQSQQGLMQAVTLADGTTAYIQHKKGANKFMEGQAVTLEDGTTAIVQASTTARVLPVQPAAAVQGDLSANKFIDGQAVQLEDGTTAFIHNTPKEGFQAIQLEDGTTAYLAASVAEGLFAEAANLNSTAMPLEQVPGVSQTVTPFSEASGTATYTIINASPEGLTPEKVLAMTDRAYKCTFEGCGRLYTTPHHLKVHERSHTGDRPFRCVEPGCGKAFATSYGLKSHVRVHTGEKPYKCTGEGCNKAFKTSGDLQKHVRTHTGERPFKCPFEGCERSFTTSNIRKVHIRTHTGERPYVCEEAGCGRAFASATNYKNHIRIHTGEKPYVCTVANCGKRFTEYSSLYKHHVVHTHAKPYECNHCNKNYRQTSTLAMHKRTAHNEEMTPEAEAELFAHHGVGEELDDMPDAKRARLFTLAGEGSLTEGTPGEAGDQDGTLVINTAQQIAMVSTNGQTVTDEAAISSALQANQQAATLTLQQLQQQGLAGVSMGEGGQIFVVTDPAQLEALQQLAVQQLELHPTGTMDMSVGINTDSHHGTIIVSGGDNSSLMSDAAQSSDTPSLLHDAVQASDNSLLQEPVTGE